ncbi:MAG: hypothetical protein ACM359_22425 [Bacillota bacterium]
MCRFSLSSFVGEHFGAEREGMVNRLILGEESGCRTDVAVGRAGLVEQHRGFDEL